MSQDSPVVLYADQYVHVINNETGSIELVEGPTRFYLQANKSIDKSLGIQTKIIVKERQYAVILNPYNQESKQTQFGMKEIRQGPSTFSLYPGESLLNSRVLDADILNKNEYIFLQALKDHYINNTSNNTSTGNSTGDKKLFKAGEMRRVIGPTIYYANTNEERIGDIQSAINVGENEAIYIRNVETSELKTVKGPTSYFLECNEELYYKKLTDREYDALELPNQSSFNAYHIQIQKNEIVCIIDHKKGIETFHEGPKSMILGSHEGLRTLSISGGNPKVENSCTIAIVNKGPDFMTDGFLVRTKDNAVLQMELTYKWQFLMSDKKVSDEEYDKVFSGDFIGYSCQSLRSRIRELASGHYFESFHKGAADILRNNLFKDYKVEFNDETSVQVHGRLFREFNFFVYAVDVKELRPVDKEIAQLLDSSIKSSMNIMCNKLQENAKNLAEKEEIQSQIEFAKLKKNLIQIKNSNMQKEKIEKSRIEGQAKIEREKAENDSISLLKKAKYDSELNQIKETMQLLDGDKGDLYIEYVKLMNATKNVRKATIVPQSTQLKLNVTQY
ncbi:predicted protein [Naegleria gruberi]|uniref:Major vault protein n=1 Tax=Naegleria gruberi TaxID=5762 RepID=D2V5B9_NAEGR|nr:uncharacterized protein NAEGRDRAFT_63766 [Naegleria gruberi]EFC48084.1 predicted protein [Naegleria gruberi]|eukprot:XP_002680828.1 predicted protein [Naegleria gruberi strain NEG-M]